MPLVTGALGLSMCGMRYGVRLTSEAETLSTQAGEELGAGGFREVD